MKVLVKSFGPILRLHVSHQPIIPVAQLRKSSINRNQLPLTSQIFHSRLTSYSYYSFSSSKQKQPPNQQSSSSNTTKDFKLSQLKQIFQTKQKKYNLKALLKILHTLKVNNVPLSPLSVKQFDYLLLMQLNNLDHPTANYILQMCHRNGQMYQPKSNNKLLRGINLKFQKNKFLLVPQHVQKTLKLLAQMKFPKTTLSRVIFSLLKETDPSKRVICFIDNLNVLRITLMGVEMVELDLEIKKRLLENLMRIKPKTVVELTYYYSILRTAVTRLDEAVIYEAQKKTVYDLAFNPYSMYQEQQTNQNPQNQQNISPPNTTTSKPPQPKHPSQPQTPKQINPLIMQRLVKQKQQIIQQTLNKIDIRQVSEQLYNQLVSAIKKDSDIELEWRDVKQVGLLLIGNWFGLEGKEKRDLVRQLIERILREGLQGGGNKKGEEKGNQSQSQSHISSKKLIRLPQFIIFVQQLSSSTTIPSTTLLPYLTSYHQKYYSFMNLEQKLMFIYHQSKLLNHPINLTKIKEQLTQVTYGLNPQEFGWLNKVLSTGSDKHSKVDKQTVREIWKMVERNLDMELEMLEREKVEQKVREEQELKERREEMERRNKQNKDKEQKNSNQQKDKYQENSNINRDKTQDSPKDKQNNQ